MPFKEYNTSLMIVTTLTYQRIKDGDSEDVILIKGDPKTDDIQSLSTGSDCVICVRFYIS